MKKMLMMFFSLCILIACNREDEIENKEQYYTKDGKINNVSYRVIGSMEVNIMDIYYYNGNDFTVKHISGAFGNKWTSEVFNGISPEYIGITNVTAYSKPNFNIDINNPNINNSTLKCQILINGKVVKETTNFVGKGPFINNSIKW